MILIVMSEEIQNLKFHDEAAEYEGCEYTLGRHKFIQRTAKVTPKKDGQFVTLWKRNRQGITAPFTESDDFDFVAILCHKGSKSGCFLFPKDILSEKGILQISGKKASGKRGFRVYPTWDKPTNKQALNTQKWQQEYFCHN